MPPQPSNMSCRQPTAVTFPRIALSPPSTAGVPCIPFFTESLLRYADKLRKPSFLKLSRDSIILSPRRAHPLPPMEIDPEPHIAGMVLVAGNRLFSDQVQATTTTFAWSRVGMRGKHGPMLSAYGWNRGPDDFCNRTYGSQGAKIREPADRDMVVC